MRVLIPLRTSTSIYQQVQSIAELEQKDVKETAYCLLLRGLVAYRHDGIVREQGMGHLYVAPNFNPKLNKQPERGAVTERLPVPQAIRDELQSIAEKDERKISEVAFWLLIRGLKKYGEDFLLTEL